MKITIEVCCETLGERRGDKIDAAIELIRGVLTEAEESGALLDPDGVSHSNISTPGRPEDVVGFIKVEG